MRGAHYFQSVLHGLDTVWKRILSPYFHAIEHGRAVQFDRSWFPWIESSGYILQFFRYPMPLALEYGDPRQHKISLTCIVHGTAIV